MKHRMWCVSLIEPANESRKPGKGSQHIRGVSFSSGKEKRAGVKRCYAGQVPPSSSRIAPLHPLSSQHFLIVSSSARSTNAVASSCVSQASRSQRHIVQNTVVPHGALNSCRFKARRNHFNTLNLLSISIGN